MQSELTEVSQNRSSKSPSPNPNQSSNHGLHHFNSGDLGQSHPLDGDGSTQEPSGTTSTRKPPRTRSSAPSVDSQGSNTYTSSLSSPSTSASRSGSPVNRIIEHERATAKTSRKSEESHTFFVVPGIRGNPRVRLEDFPNGL